MGEHKEGKMKQTSAEKKNESLFSVVHFIIFVIMWEEKMLE